MSETNNKQNIDDTYDDEGEEEQGEEETKEITKEDVEKNIKSMPRDYLFHGLKEQGFYTIEINKDKDLEKYQNDDDTNNNDDEKNIIYKVQPTSLEDIIDRNTSPPKLKEEYVDKNIVFSYGNDEVFLGKIKLYTYKIDDGTERTKVIPSDEGGCLYKKGRLVYKGYFANGKKTIGIEYKQNGEKFFKNFKGAETKIEHNNKDLILSVVREENMDVRACNDLVDGYKNYIHINKDNGRIIKDTVLDFTKIENVKISINNGYKFDFNKTHYDYLQQDGEIKKYLPSDEEEMYINVDKLVEYIELLIDNTNGKLKNIEISGINNFGFISDKNKKELNDAVANKLKKKLYDKKINLYFCNTCQQEIANVEDIYKDGKRIKTIADKGKEFHIFDAEKGKWNDVNEEFYKQKLIENGYHNNEIISKINNYALDSLTNSENSLTNSKILCDIDTFDDRVLKAQTNQTEKIKKKLEQEKASLEKEKQQTIKQPKTTKNKNRSINFFEGCLIALSGIIFPVIGGLLMYNYLKEKDMYENINQEEKANKNETGKKADNINQQDNSKNTRENLQKNNSQTKAIKNNIINNLQIINNEQDRTKKL